MNNTDSKAMLRRLMDHAEVKSDDWYGWRAELLGHECASDGLGECRQACSEAWLNRRYQQGYDEARLKGQIGEITLSPLEVVLLTEAQYGA